MISIYQSPEGFLTTTSKIEHGGELFDLVDLGQYLEIGEGKGSNKCFYLHTLDQISIWKSLESGYVKSIADILEESYPNGLPEELVQVLIGNASCEFFDGHAIFKKYFPNLVETYPSVSIDFQKQNNAGIDGFLGDWCALPNGDYTDDIQEMKIVLLLIQLKNGGHFVSLVPCDILRKYNELPTKDEFMKNIIEKERLERRRRFEEKRRLQEELEQIELIKRIERRGYLSKKFGCCNNCQCFFMQGIEYCLLNKERLEKERLEKESIILANMYHSEEIKRENARIDQIDKDMEYAKFLAVN